MDKVEKYLKEDWGSSYTNHHELAKKLKRLANDVDTITFDSPNEGQERLDLFFKNVDKFIKDASKKIKPIEKSYNLYLKQQIKDFGWEVNSSSFYK